MKQILAIARKEFNSYFSSPMALIFVGVFLAATLFTFFWVDTFWTRGIADVRSLFRWMPVLMIFLVAALTMRQWSEEQQSGTLEMLFTLPVKLYQLVIGKFLAVLMLVVVALALTIFVPLSVGQLGDLDWGPVIGGYVAALLMASAYIAIGLFISSRTGNQIVALILTVIVCGLLHLIGSRQITDFLGADVAETLRAFGSGSRFESIERGVIDLRDLVYYLSLTVFFLVVNVISLDTKRWGRGKSTENYRFNAQTTVALLAVNILVFNFVLFPFQRARLDLTEDREYSLSETTRNVLESLPEPLLIRGYFSEQNHPLLMPLIPRVRDMLEEYRIAAGDNVEIEILDPVQDPEKEAEANQTYGITPAPLQTNDRYGVAVLNVYFDILIRYGDQNVVLGLNDLIQIDQFGNGDINVTLKNLEYDLTRSIKRVVSGFQSIDAVLASLPEPARLTLFYTPASLPEAFNAAPATIEQVANEMAEISDGKLIYEAVDLSASGEAVDPQALYDQYGIEPLSQSFLSPDYYYLHMRLEAGGKTQVIYPVADMSEASVTELIEGALQRSSTGFLKVVGIWTPPAQQQDMFGQVQQSLQQYQAVQQALQENYEVTPLDLSSGEMPGNIDVALILNPENLTEADRYAIDQYLMRGGTVIVAAGNYRLNVDQFSGGLGLAPLQNGLADVLASYGITIEPTLVMDTQNDPFPAESTRNVGGFAVSQIEAIDYPYFIDVRREGMADSPILAGLPALSIAWASPLNTSAAEAAGRQVTTLLESSDRSWITTSTQVQPNFQLYSQYGFPVEGEFDAHPLAVIVEGRFDSFYKDQPSPFENMPADPNNPITAPAATLESSPDNARLIVIGSSEFLNDNVFNLASAFSQESTLNTIQFVQNMLDWSTEDTDLLSIRTRGSNTRLLDPLEEREQQQWEGLNYALALISLVALGGLWQWRRRSEQPMPLIGGDDEHRK